MTIFALCFSIFAVLFNIFAFIYNIYVMKKLTPFTVYYSHIENGEVVRERELIYKCSLLPRLLLLKNKDNFDFIVYDHKDKEVDLLTTVLNGYNESDDSNSQSAESDNISASGDGNRVVL